MIINDTKKNINTPNANHVCTGKRPCYRFRRCRRCLDRKIKFIAHQAKRIAGPDVLCSFVTIKLKQVEYPRIGFERLKVVKAGLTRVLRNSGSYILAAAIGVTGPEFHPHFHALAGPVSERDICRVFLKKGIVDSNIHIKIHRVNFASAAARRIGYMLKLNYQPSLAFNVGREKLLTSSRDLVVGKPTRKAWEGIREI